jgi:hypothetical protein
VEIAMTETHTLGIFGASLMVGGLGMILTILLIVIDVSFVFDPRAPRSWDKPRDFEQIIKYTAVASLVMVLFGLAGLPFAL